MKIIQERLFLKGAMNCAPLGRVISQIQTFLDSKLIEVDFTEADLTKVNFDNCDLSGAIFERTNLEKANFNTAFNYSIDPEDNKIKGAKFSISGLAGLLENHKIIIAK